MNWSDFYLVCFLVGFGLSALAFFAGSVHLHLPHLHLHHGVHVGHGSSASGRGGLSWFNFGTIAAFLAMTQHRLGQKDQASATLQRLRDRLRKLKTSEGDPLRALVREAEALLRAGKP